jgi:hypothetical protein
LRDHIAACVQLRHDSPLAQRHRPEADPLAEMTDAQLAAYADAHLGDEVLAAAMEPINRWADTLQEPDWERIAARLNGFLGRTWPAPPWDGGQVATVAMCISLAQETTGD